MSITNCKIWDVWLAKVKYEDKAIVEKRPVLIIGRQQWNVLAIKMTKKPPRDNKEYILKDWRTVGLNVQTTVRTSKILNLIDTDLVHRIGSLSIPDIIAIQKLMIV